MKFGLTENTIQLIQSVFAKHETIEDAFIYGSRAKGNYREGSDIDITLKGKSLTDETKTAVFFDLDELNIPFMFDISIYEKIQSPELKEHIDRVGEVFYSKKNNV